jgi:nucleotide-binding universal stress UspA family protein
LYRQVAGYREAEMFQKLLFAMDDTERSEVALSFATAVARECSAVVHVLYVNEYVVGSRGVPVFSDEKSIALVTDAICQLRSEGIRATGSVRRALYRRVAPTIASMATAVSADAIILGTGRSRHLGRLFSHHVRERVIRLTSLPVIAAPSPLGVTPAEPLDVAELVNLHRDRQPSGTVSA